MNSRRLLTQFGSVSAGRIIAALLQGVSLILIARAVTPGQFGLVSAVLGVAWVAQTVFDLGLSTFILRERTRQPESGLVPAALALNNRLSLALCLTAAGAMAVLGATWRSEFLLLAPLAIWMSAERNADAWLGVVFADGDSRVNFTNLVAKRCLALGLFVGLDLSSVTPLLAFSAAWAVSSGLSSTAARWYVRSRLPAPAAVGVRTLVRESWPYWLHSMATQANNLDVSVAGVAGGSFQAGIFATATRLTSPLRILPTSMARAILPAASRAPSKGSKQQLKKYCVAMFLGMASVYAVLFFLTPVLLPLALGDRYASATVPLQIVLVGLPFAAAASLLGALLQGAGQKRYVANVSLTISVFYLSLLAIGMSRLGAEGASVALASSYVVQSSLLLIRLLLIERHGVREHRAVPMSHAGALES